MSKKNLKFLTKLVITGGFLVWIIYTTNWEEVGMYVSEINSWQILIYLAVILAGMLISSYKWKLLAEFKGINLPLRDFFKFYFTGAFINNFMPSFIGGDTFRAYEIGKEGKKYKEAASTVIVDRITGLVGATILALIFNLINYKMLLEHKVLLVTNIIIFISLVFDLSAAKIRHISYIRNIGRKIIPEKIIGFLRELETFDHSSNVLIKSVLWGMIFSIIGLGLSNYILFRALGIEISLLNYFSVIFLIAIVSSIPITVNNIGLKEWAYVTFFGLFGVSGSQVIIVAILSRFLQMILSFLALPAYLKAKKEVVELREKQLPKILA